MNITKKKIKNNNGTLDIVQLIEKNPITRLTKDYQDKLLQKVKTNFTEPQQQILVSSMICYLNYNSKTDFVIDMNLIWKWLGYDRKDFCKTLLVKHFIQDIDYIINVKQKDDTKLGSTTAEAKTSHINLGEEKGFPAAAGKPQTPINLGGRPIEQILMNIHTFKKLCLKSNTKKADEVHDYFIKLEETFLEILNEESIELKLQLEQKDIELKKTQKQLEQKTKLKVKKWYDTEPGDTVYAVISNTEDVKNNNENTLITIGKTKNAKSREVNYMTHNQNGEMFHIRKCFNCELTEKVIFHILDKYRIEKDKEWFEISKELAIYTIDIVCDFLDKFIIYSEELPKSNIKENLNISLELVKNLSNEIKKNNFGIIQNDKQLSIVKKNKNDLDAFDYDKFISEKCELNSDYTCIPEEILGAYILWCRTNVDTNRKNLLFNHLKTKFTMTKTYLEKYKSKISMFVGIKPKEIIYQKDETDSEIQSYNKFLNEKCDIGFISKILEKDFLKAYSEFINKELSNDELIKIKAYFNNNFYFGNINISKEKKKYGYTGFKLKTDKETIHALRNKRFRPVNKININTKEIEREFISINETAFELKVDYNTVLAYLKLKKVFNKCYILQYKDVEEENIEI